MINKIEKLPDSPAMDFNLKDTIKAVGLTLLLLFSDSIPHISQYLTTHDFGQYNDLVKALFFIAVWMLQRFFKNNQSSIKAN